VRARLLGAEAQQVQRAADVDFVRRLRRVLGARAEQGREVIDLGDLVHRKETPEQERVTHIPDERLAAHPPQLRIQLANVDRHDVHIPRRRQCPDQPMPDLTPGTRDQHRCGPTCPAMRTLELMCFGCHGEVPPRRTYRKPKNVRPGPILGPPANLWKRSAGDVYGDPPMVTRTGLIVAFVLSVAASAFAQQTAFTTLAYDEAAKAAADKDVLFVVRATADWCAPCREMDRTVFAEQRVIEWLNQHTVAVSLDIDAAPRTARELGVVAVPTMIVFKDDDELGRRRGKIDSDTMLAWLESFRVNPGATARERQDAEIAAIRATPGLDGATKSIKVADLLMRAARYEEATRVAIELWRSSDHRASDASVPTWRIQGMLQRLVAYADGARDICAGYRDELEPSPTSTARQIDDWCAFNRFLGDADMTVAWAKEALRDERMVETIAGDCRALRATLEQTGNWALLGLTYADPVGSLDEAIERYASLDESAQRHARAGIIDRAAVMYGALLAASRDIEAAAVAETLFAFDRKRKTRRSFITRALIADAVRPEHLEWLDRMRKKDPAMRDAVEKALRSSGTQTD
jgi:thiol-disulfide isomerase/thioredoxin